ncbi:aldo/keto reductase [Pelagicoccus enzymogenes]|uniref:aldo/keto reductase n=1 Tax=Pelagicoccus enzymogenes TaxID=2773457 RepID=UPI00280FA345|nr:aldo/keto reductase [Pelagicoccus enzymogenes]MDQ8199860.1 aldo/keto reductase [Pelagicoccus enzymogenes]
MKLRRLGSSGMMVSPVCLGTMTFGSPVGKEEAIRIVRGAMDLGINFIDTANVYEGYSRYQGSPGGVSEEILGAALRGRREEVVLATKCGAPNGPGTHDMGLTAKTILRELDGSLRRLGTDYIDLYHIHWPDAQTPLETVLSTMETAYRQGKIRAFGVSNHFAWQLCELLWLADKRNWPKVVASQIPFSLLRRDYQNDLEFCRKHEVGVTPWQALQGGLLTGKYRRGKQAPEGSRMADSAWLSEPENAVFDQIEATEELAKEQGLSLTEYALAWTLAQPAMTSLIVGVKSMAQVEAAVKGAEAVLPAEVLERQDAITPPPPSNAPIFKR